MGYEKDISLERRHAPTIKAILGNYFIGQDAVHDRKRGTDFEIFHVKPFTVGVRLRRHKYLIRYPSEFTLRWSRPSGIETEIHKIRAGYVDYILYGFVDEKEKHIMQYFLGDLRVFRACEPTPLGIFLNKPPDSRLAAYRLADMPEGFVLKEWKRKANA